MLGLSLGLWVGLRLSSEEEGGLVPVELVSIPSLGAMLGANEEFALGEFVVV